MYIFVRAASREIPQSEITVLYYELLKRKNGNVLYVNLNRFGRKEPYAQLP